MSEPLTDEQVQRSERGYYAFLDRYDLQFTDPLAQLVHQIVISSGDPRPQVLSFLYECALCPTCLGNGYVFNKDYQYSVCPNCRGTGLRPLPTDKALQE